MYFSGSIPALETDEYVQEQITCFEILMNLSFLHGIKHLKIYFRMDQILATQLHI